MKKILSLLFFSVIASGICTGQPVLRNFENLPLGSKTTYLGVEADDIVAGKGGPAVTWSFTNLVLDKDTFIERMVVPTETPQGSNFPNANIAMSSDNGYVVYYKQTPDTNYVVGELEPTFSITFKYLEPATYISRPFTYGDTIRDTHRRTYVLQGTTYRGSGTTLNVADGYGSLIMRGNVYDDVLRIRYEQVSNDTSTLDGSVITVTTITHAWYDTLHASALLKIDSVSISSPFFSEAFKNVSVFHQEFNTSVNAPEFADSKLKVFIRDNKLEFINSGKNMQAANVQMVNAAGQVVMNEKINLNTGAYSLPLNAESIKPGIYFVKMNYSANTIQKQDCIKVIKW